MNYQKFREEHLLKGAGSGDFHQNTLEERFLEFAVRIIQFLQKFPKESVMDVCRIQLSRCATSIGANYQEAQAFFFPKRVYQQDWYLP